MKAQEPVFVDSGAWIALALARDPFHERAREAWQVALEARCPIFTSVPVVIETFTFLERNTRRDVAIAWKDSLAEVPSFTALECTAADLNTAWRYFSRPDLHKLSAVDATSFVLMEREQIGLAFTFDHHFASVGFRLLG